jgi:hypothetical protein
MAGSFAGSVSLQTPVGASRSWTSTTVAEIPDLSGLFPQPDDPVDALRTAQIRAHSRVSRGSPLTVRERFEAFSSFGYHPHGLYRPDEPALAETITRTVKELGDIGIRDERISKYLRLQDYCAELEAKGTPGHWDGMQAVARSTAKYRVVAQSRRVGKTYHATREALAVAIKRPRSHIWCSGPNWDAVGRVFDEVIRLVEDLNMPLRRKRDQTDEKMLILEDYESIFEGVSLHELPSIVGVSLTFAIVDEAAFVDKIMWDRGVQPPLTDQDGQAMLLSNYFGDENWFTELAETAEADAEHRIWSIHKGTSWTNFYSFPQGRNTPSLKVVEETTDALEFMEQYGGVPVSHVRRIYREYRDRVHVLPTLTFDPNHAVILAVDPSAGAAPYAVSAIQDYGTRTHIIDEYYQDGVITDDVIPVVQTRPWVGNVTDIILDSAAPDEAERWRRAGFTNAYGVLDKPDPVDRIPILKRLLRDPALFRPFYVDRAIHILRSKQDPRHPDELKDREEIQLIYEVEESFSDAFLTDEDIHILRECAHLFIAEHCHWTRYEFKRYAFVEPRAGTNRPERPRKAYDHLMDAIGYWGWDRKRFDVENFPRLPRPYGGGGQDQPDFRVLPGLPEMEIDLVGKPIDADTRARLYLARVRQETTPRKAMAHRYVTRKQ